MSRLLGHNFNTIFRFEIIRTLKRKSFWISILLVPVSFIVIGSIVYFSNSQTEKDLNNISNNKLAFSYIDDSHIADPNILGAIGGQPASNKQQGVSDVKNGKVDAFYYFPSDLSKDKIEVYAKHTNIFENSKYAVIAHKILKTSIARNINQNINAIASDSIKTSDHYFQNNKKINPFYDMILPGVFLVLLYFIVITFSGQMLNATVEEKENRITEMLLITTKSKTLITAKILSFITLIMLQAIILIVSSVIAYMVAQPALDLPTIDLSSVTVNLTQLIIAVATFIVSTLMLGGILVVVGAASPTAREANQFMSIPMILLFGPLYLSSMAISSPDSAIIIGLVIFPLTAPVLLLLMNAMGTISPLIATISIIGMAISSIIIFAAAAKIFQMGAVNYNDRFRLTKRAKIAKVKSRAKI